METLVATVLIVIIFVLSSLTLNGMFSNTIKSDASQIEVYLNELEYLYQTERLELPHYSQYKNWEVSAERIIYNQEISIEIEAIHDKKVISRKLFENY